MVRARERPRYGRDAGHVRYSAMAVARRWSCARRPRSRRSLSGDLPRSRGVGRRLAGLDLAPEGVDASVPLVGNLLEGLVGLPGQHFELGARNPLGDESPEARRQDSVELASHHQGRRGDLRKASVVSCARQTSTCALKASTDCWCGKASASSTTCSTEPSACARGVYTQVKNASKKARSLGAAAGSQRQKLSWARSKASGRAYV